MSEAPPAVGALTDRVQFSRRETETENEGGHTAIYVPVSALWARVRGLGARQRDFADGRGVAATHQVVVRFRTDVAPGDRFTWRERVLEVIGAEDLNGRRAWLVCRCAEAGVLG